MNTSYYKVRLEEFCSWGYQKEQDVLQTKEIMIKATNKAISHCICSVCICRVCLLYALGKLICQTYPQASINAMATKGVCFWALLGQYTFFLVVLNSTVDCAVLYRDIQQNKYWVSLTLTFFFCFYNFFISQWEPMGNGCYTVASGGGAVYTQV